MSSEAETRPLPLASLLTGLQTLDTAGYSVDGIAPQYAVRPASTEELVQIVQSAAADEQAIVPWGGGTQMGVGNVPDRYDIAVDLTAHDEVLRYDSDDMTMSVQTGCRLAELNRMLGEHRQVLPVDAADPERATIGGLVAVGASGPRRFGYGPLRDLIIGMTVLMADGTIATAGGQVVKNVTGYDMMRLHHGALGSLGIVLSVNLKVIPKPQSERTVVATYQTLKDADRAAREVAASQLGVTAIVVTNPAATAEGTGVQGRFWSLAVRCEAPPSAVVRQAERVVEYVNEQSEHVFIEDSTHESEVRWQHLARALEQRPDSPDIAVRLGKSASRMRECATDLLDELEAYGEARLTLDYGSGLAYVRLPSEAVAQPDIAGFMAMMAQYGDHVTLATAPPDLKQEIDVFGDRPAGFSTFEALKANFDPNRILNSGRFIGRI